MQSLSCKGFICPTFIKVMHIVAGGINLHFVSEGFLSKMKILIVNHRDLIARISMDLAGYDVQSRAGRDKNFV